ncbi:hypothetical protein COEREDRAFT_82864 [Coemansia reversa NRRL 1564]|uniref:Uncharacterized protein n=1 Tax=Coemansia reversa (strain ATCC 12441 / NRRL 1564) TaxID=763665 RepID=A0A2G5B561_COERN|nr:hypothetical protein COEREDRAFT_82864 [Coemansia reversa NRRL 1564]|eukprot:PIA14183.1 hypothetical protein COEREDRAFT_82864 [Coemansia reversa NRRL 1564]
MDNSPKPILLKGIAQLWTYNCSKIPAPRQIANVPISTCGLSEKVSDAHIWFQGHLFTSDGDGKKQHAIIGIPAQAPPPIHSCMVSSDYKPIYFDIFITEYLDDSVKISYYALNVEQGGSGDAIELSLKEEELASSTLQCQTSAFLVLVGNAQRVKELRFSTTRLISGNRGQGHLERYAPEAMDLYTEYSETPVVCLGAISIQ